MLAPSPFAAAGLLCTYFLLAGGPSQAAAASIGSVPVPYLDLDPLGAFQSENFTTELQRRADTSNLTCANNDDCSSLDRPDVSFSVAYCNLRTKTCAWGCYRGYTWQESTGVCAKGRAPRVRPADRPPATPTAEESSTASEEPTSTEGASSLTTSISTAESTSLSSTSAAPSPEPSTPTGRACSLTVDCAGADIPLSAHQWCDVKNSVCSWRCNTGFVSTGTGCTRSVEPQETASSTSTSADPAPTAEATQDEPTSTATSSTTTTTSAAPIPTSNNPYLIDASADLKGVSAFQASTGGWNTNSLISWYRTNSAADSTNGMSWCFSKYNDATPGFAPSLKTMLSVYGGGWTDLQKWKSMKLFCGLEAEFTTPDGRTATLYIHDAFDDAWVRTPNAVDVIIGSFAQLFGRSTTNKNDVVQNASWRLTGKRDTRYLFNSGNAVYGVPWDSI